MPDSRGERCFVYVRYWPDFTDRFPYERFNGLPEDAIERELRHALAVELWQRHSEITRSRHVEKQRRIKALTVWQTQFIARPGGPRYNRQPRIEKLRKTRSTRFSEFARYLGWHSGGGPIDFLVSPRIWIASVDSPEVAHDLVNELTGRRPVNDDERKHEGFLNPRYGIAGADDLTSGEQAHSLLEIEQLRSTDSVDMWGSIVRLHLRTVDQFLKVRKAVAQPAGVPATAPNTPPADELAKQTHGCETISREYRDSSGKISVTLHGPDAEPFAERSRVLCEYNWPVIVGALREVIRYLRDNPTLRDLKPANDDAAYLQACAARTAIGQLMCAVWHCFRIDPRRNDGVGVDDSQVVETLFLCLQERKFLQAGAIQLWRVYQSVQDPLTGSAVPSLDDAQIERLEQAIDAVASMTVDEEPELTCPQEWNQFLS